LIIPSKFETIARGLRRLAQKNHELKDPYLDLSYKKYFDLGIVIPASFPEMSDGTGPIIENLNYVLGTGLFSLVETTYRKDEEGFTELRNYLDQKRVRTIYLAPFVIYQKGLDLNCFDENVRQEAVTVLKEFVERAYFIKAEKLMICSGPDPGVANREKAKKQLMKSLNELLEWTHQFWSDYLLELILENFDRQLQKKRLLGPTNESVELIMEVKKNFRNINLIIDQSHLRQLDENSGESLALAKNCLGHVHLANCLLRDKSHPQWGDGHPPFNMVGSELGTEDIVNLFGHLFEIGYLEEDPKGELPTISLEVKPLPDGDKHATFKETCDTFLEAWGKFKSLF
jgi:sugar phosphate isomerase/epimerase